MPEMKRKMCFSNPGCALMMRLRAAGLTLTLTLVQTNARAPARLLPSLLAQESTQELFQLQSTKLSNVCANVLTFLSNLKLDKLEPIRYILIF